LKLGGPYQGTIGKHDDITCPAFSTDRVMGVLNAKESSKVGINKAIHLENFVGLENQSLVSGGFEIAANPNDCCLVRGLWVVSKPP